MSAGAVPAGIILYVEDDEDYRTLQAELLRDEGFVVHEAESIASARAILPAIAGLEVVLTDRSLPDGDAWAELVPELKRLEPGVRVVTLTADSQPHADRAAQRAGCDAFLPKLCSPDAVVSRIREQIAFLRVEVLRPRRGSV